MKDCCRAKTGKCLAVANPQPDECFAKDRKRPSGLTPHCKSCLKGERDRNKDQRRETIKRWRAMHPEKLKEYRIKSAPQRRARTKKWQEKNLLKSRYGISNEEWKRMFDAQCGQCALCGIHQSKTKKALHVDHCHKSNKVRGLLCSICNQALGMFKDDTVLMQRAIEYLGAH